MRSAGVWFRSQTALHPFPRSVTSLGARNYKDENITAYSKDEITSQMLLKTRLLLAADRRGFRFFTVNPRTELEVFLF